MQFTRTCTLDVCSYTYTQIHLINRRFHFCRSKLDTMRSELQVCVCVCQRDVGGGGEGREGGMEGGKETERERSIMEGGKCRGGEGEEVERGSGLHKQGNAEKWKGGEAERGTARGRCGGYGVPKQGLGQRLGRDGRQNKR